MLLSSLSLEIRNTSTGVSFHPKFLNLKFAYDVLNNRKTDCRIRSRIRDTYKSKGNNHEWEKNQVSSLFWKPKYTQLENEAPSTKVKGPQKNYNRSVNLKCDHPLWEFALRRGNVARGEAFGIKRLSRGGESIVKFYIFSALHWEILRYGGVWQIFMRYLCNCALEFWYCGISKDVEVFVIGWAIFSTVVSNFSISPCSVTVFHIPQAALQPFFLRTRILLPQDRLW